MERFKYFEILLFFNCCLRVYGKVIYEVLLIMIYVIISWLVIHVLLNLQIENYWSWGVALFEKI